MKTNEARRLEILNNLNDQYDWITIAKLAQNIGSSERAIVNDLSFFKEYKEFLTVETSSKGLRLQFKENLSLKTVYQYFLRNSPAYNLIELVFFYEGNSQTFFMDELLISESTIYRLVRNIDRSLSKHFDINLNYNPISLQGSEDKIRHFYYTYFAERFYHSQWPFANIDEKALDELLTYVFKQMKLTPDFASFSHFKLKAAINLLRYRSKNLVEENNLNQHCLKIVTDNPTNCTELLTIQARLGLILTKSAFTQLFPCVFKEHYAFSYSQLEDFAKNNKRLSDSITFLSNLIEGFTIQSEFSEHQKRELILKVTNAVFEMDHSISNHIIYDRNQRTLENISKYYPDFFRHVSESIKHYQELIALPLDQETNQLLVGIFSEYWQNLVPFLQDKWKQVNVCIISDLSVGHANLVKDTLLYSFGPRIHFTIYQELTFSEDKLRELKPDIIIANFPMPIYDFAKTLCIDDIPNTKTIKYLTELVNIININKNIVI